MKFKNVQDAFSKYKYPILILLVGVLILCIPSASRKPEEETFFRDEETRLSTILEECRGVGEASVLLSDKGAVIVCDGADDPNVRLDIVNSVRAYTGLGWDDIKVFKAKQK